MREATANELEFVIGQMRNLQREHPKAKVLYSFEERRILVTYPLPQDFPLVKDIKYENFLKD